MQLIQTVTVGSGGAAAIAFNSIPQTFTDLYIVLSARVAGTSIGVGQKFNGSTANFSGRFLEGSGSSAISYTAANIISYATNSTNTASTFGNSSIYIPNYTLANNKSVSLDSVTENNATAAFQLIGAVLWSSSSAITDIEFYHVNGTNFVQYSSASLYGITKGSDGIVTVS